MRQERSRTRAIIQRLVDQGHSQHRIALAVRRDGRSVGRTMRSMEEQQVIVRTMPGVRGQDASAARLTNANAIAIIQALHNETHSVMELAELYGVTPGLICHIRSKRRWAWLSDILEERNFSLTETEYHQLCGGQIVMDGAFATATTQ